MALIFFIKVLFQKLQTIVKILLKEQDESLSSKFALVANLLTFVVNTIGDDRLHNLGIFSLGIWQEGLKGQTHRIEIHLIDIVEVSG